MKNDLKHYRTTEHTGILNKLSVPFNTGVHETGSLTNRALEAACTSSTRQHKAARDKSVNLPSWVNVHQTDM